MTTNKYLDHLREQIETNKFVIKVLEGTNIEYILQLCYVKEHEYAIALIKYGNEHGDMDIVNEGVKGLNSVDDLANPEYLWDNYYSEIGTQLIQDLRMYLYLKNLNHWLLDDEEEYNEDCLEVQLAESMKEHNCIPEWLNEQFSIV